MKKFIAIVVAIISVVFTANAETTEEVSRTFHNIGLSTKDNCDWKKMNTDIVFTEAWMNVENSQEITTYIFAGKLEDKVKVRGNNTYKIHSYKVSPTMDILGTKVTATKVCRVEVYNQEGTYLREWYEIYNENGSRTLYK